jgi:spermidine synthase
MALTWGSKGSVLGEADDAALAKLFKEAGFDTDYYTPALHNAAFKLPAWLVKIARGAGDTQDVVPDLSAK